MSKPIRVFYFTYASSVIFFKNISMGISIKEKIERFCKRMYILDQVIYNKFIFVRIIHICLQSQKISLRKINNLKCIGFRNMVFLIEFNCILMLCFERKSSWNNFMDFFNLWNSAEKYFHKVTYHNYISSNMDITFMYNIYNALIF